MRFIILLFLLAVTGCSTTSTIPVNESKPELTEDQKVQWNLMIGSWYGKQPTKSNGSREWIVRRYVNGTYRTQFRSTNLTQSEEVGEWGISGDIYFSIFRGWVEGKQFTPADPTDPYNRDTYDILNITETRFIYRHRETGNEFTVIKVPNDFTFE